MNLDSCYKLIEVIGNIGIKYLSEYNYIPGGQNGPYQDTETPVRNTSHFIRIFSYLYKKTGESKYKEAIINCVKYLKTKDAIPFSNIYHIRKDPSKDFSNGVIGQAWVIEGFIEAAIILKDENLFELAKLNFLAHPFDEKLKLWRIVNVDGSYNQIDWTFNHQLWFAAIGSELNQYVQSTKIEHNLKSFFQKLPEYFNTYNSGLIKHLIQPNSTKKDKVKKVAKTIYSSYQNLKLRKSLVHKEAGYHAFNLYGLAIIKTNHNLDFFSSSKFKQSIEYLNSNSFETEIRNNFFEKDITFLEIEKKEVSINLYGLPYNPIGFELPFILKTFRPNEESLLPMKYFALQLEKTYNNKTGVFDKDTFDPLTLTSRIYELLRYF